MTATVTNLRIETARLALLRVDESTDERRTQVTVTLAFDGDEHEGTASGSPADSVRADLVAAATLDAIGFVDGAYELIDTAAAFAGGIDVALVVVTDPEGNRPLIGTAALDDDNRQVAYAKATLDAVNRRIAHAL